MARLSAGRARLVEPNGDGEIAGLPQPWKEARVQERCFAGSRRSENDCEHFAFQQTQQLIGFALAAIEQLGVRLAVGREAEPGFPRIFKQQTHAGLLSRRRSLIRLRASSTSSARDSILRMCRDVNSRGIPGA